MSTPEDKEAFLKLIEGNRRIIFKICNSYCRKKDEREDLAQEIIFQLWKAFPAYDSAYKYSTWMYRIALNVAISFYRRERTLSKNTLFTGHILELDAPADENPELEQHLHQLNVFISELKELDKALLILYLEEKTYREIAHVLGISETNVATKLSRIKHILKNKFTQHT